MLERGGAGRNNEKTTCAGAARFPPVRPRHLAIRQGTFAMLLTLRDTLPSSRLST